MSDQGKNNWSAEFYDDRFAEDYLVRKDKTRLAFTVSFLEEKLNLRKGDTVFDQCCGVGGISIGLAERGYKTIGVDLMPSYIERARRDAAAAGFASLCQFDAADANVYTAQMPCDAAINWWTSFGYSADDQENIKMLRCVAASLKTGGAFALDYMNAAMHVADFGNDDVIIRETEKNGIITTWETLFNRKDRMVVKKWSYIDENGQKIQKQGGGAKLYSKNDLRLMLSACGLGDIVFYGSTKGEPVSDHSPRCIAIAVKN